MKKHIKTNLDSQIEAAMAFCESEIARITEEAEQLDKIETYREAARNLHELYVHFIQEGFTEEQSWELIKIITAK
jgi:glutathionylspermidine synthase